MIDSLIFSIKSSQHYFNLIDKAWSTSWEFLNNWLIDWHCQLIKINIDKCNMLIPWKWKKKESIHWWTLAAGNMWKFQFPLIDWSVQFQFQGIDWTKGREIANKSENQFKARAFLNKFLSLCIFHRRCRFLESMKVEWEHGIMSRTIERLWFALSDYYCSQFMNGNE